MVRFKNRYITVEIKSQTNRTFKSNEITRELFHKVKEVFGEYGTASIQNGFSASYCNELTNVVILRVKHGPHKYITTTLPLITKIGKDIAKLRIIHVGATLRHSYMNIVRHQKTKLDRILKQAKTEEEKEALEAKVLQIKGILQNAKDNISMQL
ncbi:ribonuclease P/MRP protein subunit POP5 [Cimex lectularius]|uniref:Ribonuclease P/MRP protein subunit POP5 n=1 Tax=Cimex lectularius TaxID=79782 RepID=A0A8I6R7G3_CIMLE|nr:ribonuclease P/MRP protein subunit POP5 [Cimex lectularius]